MDKNLDYLQQMKLNDFIEWMKSLSLVTNAKLTDLAEALHIEKGEQLCISAYTSSDNYATFNLYIASEPGKTEDDFEDIRAMANLNCPFGEWKNVSVWEDVCIRETADAEESEVVT